MGGSEVEKPPHVSKEVEEDMAFYGLSDEIANVPKEEQVKEPDYEVWPENLAALNLFLGLESQWEMLISPDGELIRTALRTSAIEFKLKYTNGIPRRDYNKLVQSLAWMEAAAVAVLDTARIKRQEKRIEELERERQNK